MAEFISKKLISMIVDELSQILFIAKHTAARGGRSGATNYAPAAAGGSIRNAAAHSSALMDNCFTGAASLLI